MLVRVAINSSSVRIGTSGAGGFWRMALLELDLAAFKPWDKARKLLTSLANCAIWESSCSVQSTSVTFSTAVALPLPFGSDNADASACKLSKWVFAEL